MQMRNTVSSDILHLELKQIGATAVKIFSTKSALIVFEINDELTVSYFCTIRNEEKVSLQRIEPYPVKNLQFETIDDIVDFIKRDVKVFENASNSSNFKTFLNIIEKNYQVRKEMEDLFLMNNVPEELLREFEALEDEYLQKLQKIECEKVGLID